MKKLLFILLLSIIGCSAFGQVMFSSENDHPHVYEQTIVFKDSLFHCAVWVHKLYSGGAYTLIEEYYGIPTRKVNVVLVREVLNDPEVRGYFVDESYFFDGVTFYDEDGEVFKVEDMEFISWKKENHNIQW